MDNSVEFVQEIKVDTDIVALNRNVYHIMMHEVMVKEEDVSIEDNNRVEMFVDQDDGDDLRRNAAAPSTLNKLNVFNSKLHWQSKLMPKPIKHRRLSRIEKPNNLAYHRHFNHRRIVEEILPEPANQQSFAVNENVIGEQSVLSIHSDIEDTAFRQTVDPHASDEMSSSTANETPHTSANPLDIAFQESTIGSLAAESQFSEAGGVDIVSEFGIAMTDVSQPFEPSNTADVQFGKNDAGLPIVLDVQQIQETAETEAIHLEEMHPVENRCAPCEYTFKTAKNFGKHLQSKKHSQKIARLNKLNVI